MRLSNWIYNHFYTLDGRKPRLPRKKSKGYKLTKDVAFYFNSVFSKLDRMANKKDKFKVDISVFRGHDSLGKADLDNYSKAILDGITKTEKVWVDDKQVDELNIKRIYSGKHTSSIYLNIQKSQVDSDKQQNQTMNFSNIDKIKKAGFSGFKKMSELFVDSTSIPKIKGVYLVLNPDYANFDFLQIGTGGHFKGKNPNVSTDDLAANWVDKALVVYIGKAGSDTGKATLHSRLKQYFGFGQGKNIGHWGGRLIWQLKNSNDLIVCWKPLPNDDPRTVESQLIKKFVTEFSKRPFANLAD